MCQHNHAEPLLAGKPIKAPIKKPGPRPCIDIPCGPDWLSGFRPHTDTINWLTESQRLRILLYPLHDHVSQGSRYDDDGI